MKERGQSAVEFAFVVPFFFALFFAVVYFGILFMDYIQYSNAARAAARDISLTQTKAERQKIITYLNSANSEKSNEKANYAKQVAVYANPLTSLYKATFSVEPKKLEDTSTNVTVSVDFELNDTGFPQVLVDLDFPPKNLKTIKYTMPLERKST